MARFPESSTVSEALLYAVLRHLEKSPFTADRFAQYALRLHETKHTPAALLYFFDRHNRMISTETLFAGLEKDPAQYCPALPTMFAQSGAASIGISLSFADKKHSDENILQLSRIVLFCEMHKIPLFEAILVCGEDAFPLCRASGSPQFTILHSERFR